MKIICYRAVFRPEGDTDYDKLYPPENPDPDTTFAAFTNNEDDWWTTREGWRMYPAALIYKGDLRLQARMHKCLPHSMFPDADWTLWVDGSLTPKTPPSELVERHKGFDITTFDRIARDCAYDEGILMANKKRDDPDKILEQCSRYLAEGYPAHNGLCATTAVLRKNTPQMREFGQRWWEEIANGCNRDQVSINYVLWKMGIPWGKFRGRWNNSPDFTWRPHYGR